MTGAPIEVIRQAYLAAAAKVPSVEELVQEAYPFSDAKPMAADGLVLLQATLKDPASSVEARDTIKRLRERAAEHHSSVRFGGLSAIQLDTNTASDHDLMVIIPLILLAITVVLMLLLRAVVAPLVLLFTTVLSFGATIGISALLFNHVWNFPGADPSVIIFGFVFLVALGIDYNIFLMSRVREETIKLGVRDGTLKALVVTGGVITSAGIVLAATFAALYVIPILFLAQIAFIVAFGVLLDTLIVRSLLVPALTLEIGHFMWWPSKLSKRK
jgi:RND superfamily putative drug exporter